MFAAIYCTFPSMLVIPILCVQAQTRLEEICPPPWIPRNHQANDQISILFQTRKCGWYCTGKAFHTGEGKLICFNTRVFSDHKYFKENKNDENYVCDCGRNIKHHSVNVIWLSCKVNIIGMNRLQCREHCNEIVAFLLLQKKVKEAIHCEYAGRDEFYNLTGELAEDIKIKYHKSGPVEGNKKYKYRECACGIRNKVIEKLEDPNALSDNFEECSKPWLSTNLWRLTSTKTCKVKCHNVCEKGVGFFYQGIPFCYRSGVATKRRTIKNGGKERCCECGYVKISMSTNDEGGRMMKGRKYIACEPPVVSDDNLLPHQCDQYCGRHMAYLYKSGRESLSIRCMKIIDSKIGQPLPLIGKCDDEIYELKNVSRKYMICRCGLNKNIMGNISAFPKKIIIPTEIRVPDSWKVKKKRSSRIYNKLNNDK